MKENGISYAQTITIQETVIHKLYYCGKLTETLPDSYIKLKTSHKSIEYGECDRNIFLVWFSDHYLFLNDNGFRMSR